MPARKNFIGKNRIWDYLRLERPGIYITDMAKTLKYPTSTMYRWANQVAQPPASARKRIAEYLKTPESKVFINQ